MSSDHIDKPTPLTARRFESEGYKIIIPHCQAFSWFQSLLKHYICFLNQNDAVISKCFWCWENPIRHYEEYRNRWVWRIYRGAWELQKIVLDSWMNENSTHDRFTFWTSNTTFKQSKSIYALFLDFIIIASEKFKYQKKQKIEKCILLSVFSRDPFSFSYFPVTEISCITIKILWNKFLLRTA